LFKPMPPEGTVREVPTGVGTVAWHELRTSDTNAAFAFYSELFGWKRSSAMDMGPEMGTYQLFSTGKEDAGGMMKNNIPNTPSHWTYYVMVDSVHAAEKRVKAKGGTVLFGPSEVPGGGWIIQGRDPLGVHFALTGPR
jgi:predicted enzyme related to lactoylglutathione lyase